MNTYLVAAGVVLAVLVLFVVVQYNKLVGQRLRIRESWSNVDVELKRRHDLIPNLVETVRGYAAHERQLFERVTALRTDARAQGDTHDRRDAERDLSRALGQVLAVAEAYPQLKADQQFLQLQGQLAETEDRIQAARRFYNGNVRDYNNQVQQFPSNLVARAFRFEAHEYFELPDPGQRAAPAVRLAA